MKVLELECKNYRNLTKSKFVPGEKINVIFGENAQGKSNILEALWIFTGGRSFRGTKDADIVTFDELKTEANLKIEKEDRIQELKIEILDKKRKVSINSVTKSSPAELVGAFCAVVFSPAHLSLLKDGPGLRRKFLDTAICQIKPGYAKILFSYNHVLAQRNALLKDLRVHRRHADTLAIWDEKLSTLAAEIVEERLVYAAHLKKFASFFHAGISSQRESLELSYVSTAAVGDEVCFEKIKEKLKKSRETDIALGYTTVGPHRDDVKISINRKVAKTYASQGQQRSAVLAIKLAEAEILKNVFQKTPVILLDDVMSELDERRQDFILNSLDGNQVFITCCEPTVALSLRNGRLFKMVNGNLEPI